MFESILTLVIALLGLILMAAGPAGGRRVIASVFGFIGWVLRGAGLAIGIVVALILLALWLTPPQAVPGSEPTPAKFPATDEAGDGGERALWSNSDAGSGRGDGAKELRP